MARGGKVRRAHAAAVEVLRENRGYPGRACIGSSCSLRRRTSDNADGFLQLNSTVMAIVDVFLVFVRASVFVYDIVTYPVYAVLQQPWNESQKKKQPLGQVSVPKRRSFGRAAPSFTTKRSC